MNMKSNITSRANTPVVVTDIQDDLFVIERMGSILVCTTEAVFDPASCKPARCGTGKQFEVSDTSSEDLQFLIHRLVEATQELQRKVYDGLGH